ncbi:hypothetical protein GWI33_016658 [Rhynchophorus ferrugineus]|uniref:Uncharacterized protein n=1 Tax=Rhynchophorus ferrugineus TaxID=354439 RepID=A0A834M8F7_RHYFE|nr:hypothetical protein GWI33_016658 [Rhynchophorus ferrugineus]
MEKIGENAKSQPLFRRTVSSVYGMTDMPPRPKGSSRDSAHVAAPSYLGRRGSHRLATPLVPLAIFRTALRRADRRILRIQYQISTH